MPFYTKRMVRFLEGKDGKRKHNRESKNEKGLRVAPSSVGTGGGSAAKAGGKSLAAEVQTTAPTEKIADNAFDQKKLLFMKGMLKAAVERLEKEKGALPVKHRYFGRYTVFQDQAPIGESATCKVFKAQHQDFKDNVLAVKIYEGEHGIDPNNSQWLKVLRVLGKKHPHIIQTWDLFHNPENNAILIFQELANKGSLLSYLQSNQMDEKQAGSWLWQILKALDYLGDVGISHRSIQPKHVLLSTKELKVKLTGFEMSAIYWDQHKEDIRNIACLPIDQRPSDPNAVSYQAPEVYGDPTKEEFDPLVADVWSLGATVYYMFAKQYPYDVTKPDTIAKDINNNVQQMQGISADGKRVVNEMLKAAATERKHIDKLVSDPWIKSFK